ncbi:MAG: alkaline phosphatase family protein [candidate division WOR-3 bacterium]
MWRSHAPTAAISAGNLYQLRNSYINKKGKFMNSPKVLIIGLDGATLDLIYPWASKGLLPNFNKLIREGSSGILMSTLQPVTPPAWATLMTGVNQGKHGLFDFFKRRPNTYSLEVTNSTNIMAPTMFDLISQSGKRLSIVNVPYTFPPRPINGIVVGGPFVSTVNRELVYPREFFDTLIKLIPDYFVIADYDASTPNPLGDFANKLLLEIQQRETLSLSLLKSESWDLFMVVSMAADEAQHSFWKMMQIDNNSKYTPYRDVILNVYQRLDLMIGKILLAAKESDPERPLYTFVVSDHGAGPISWMVNLNHWLNQEGFLEFHQDFQGIVRQIVHGRLSDFTRWYRQSVPSSVREFVRNNIKSKYFMSVKSRFETTLSLSTIDWKKTRAFALGVGGNIFVNMKGREPLGLVNPGLDYKLICAELNQSFCRMTDPETHKKIVKRVYHKDEIYQGLYVDQAPDLIIEWESFEYSGVAGYSRPKDPVFKRPAYFDFVGSPLSGSHRPEGVLIIHGPNIRPNFTLPRAHLVDIAPTVLYLLNLPIPKIFDGRVIEEAVLSLNKKIEIDNAKSFSVDLYDYSDEESEKISEHLRSLGYM